MARSVALLRAVNVGGRKVPMAALRALAEGLGWRDVSTYIASGNLLFTSDDADPGWRIEAAMAEAFGLAVPALVLTGDALRAALAACPYPDAAGNRVFGLFCWSEPTLSVPVVARWRASAEEIEVRGRAVWFHAPDGIGRSELGGRLDKAILGTPMTARNLNTLRTLAERLD